MVGVQRYMQPRSPMGRPVTITHLASGRQQVYTCDPRAAVIAAFAQERDDWSTWEYRHRYGHLVVEGRHTIGCGDWATFKAEGRSTECPCFVSTEASMDEFTERLFEMAYETCSRSGRRRRREISVRELVGAVESHWITYRDGTTNR